MFIPPGSVVKFHAEWADGFEVARHEADTLRRLAAAPARPDAEPTLPVPRLIADGTLQETYRYLVMTRVPGRPCGSSRRYEGPVERGALPAAVGGFLRWLHARAARRRGASDRRGRGSSRRRARCAPARSS